jgi:hypothetical protein
MKARTERTGKERKALVEAIAMITGEKATYLGMPTAGYEVGSIMVDRDGGICCEDEETMKELIASLAYAGISAEIEESQEEPETEEADSKGLIISLPPDKVAVGNLTNLLAAKGSLIKKALGIDELPIDIGEDRVSFPWFTEMPEADAAKAYTNFISLLCKLSKELKRASSTETAVTNEKYAFRCFLLRLGFIGPEYKTERKILLQNLSGNSSWKNGAPEKEAEAYEE